MGWLVRGVLAVTIGLAARGSALADEASPCARTQATAEAWRAAGRLTRAKESFEVCAELACADTRAACHQGLVALDAVMPHLVLRATDVEGRDYVDVDVLIDGRVRLDRLDGFSLALDPGVHVIELLGRDGATGQETIYLKEHDATVVHVVLTGGARRALAPAQPRKAPWAYALDVSVLGVGAAVLVGSLIGLASTGSVWYSIPMALGSGAVVGAGAWLLTDLPPTPRASAPPPTVGWMGWWF